MTTESPVNRLSRRPGDRINIECDILAKYVAKMLGAVKRPSSFPSVDDLREMGY